MRKLGLIATATIGIALLGGLLAWTAFNGGGPSRHALISTGRAPASNSVLVLDLAGDGADLSGHTTTSLLTGNRLSTNWTATGDDAFLAVDATALRVAAIANISRAGTPVDGGVFLRSGLQVRIAGSSTTVNTTSGWHMLGLFDANNDGVISNQDPAFQYAKVFVDADGDGTIGSGELGSLAGRVASISFSPGAGVTDSFGNRFDSDTYQTSGGASRTSVGVLFGH